MSRIAKWMRAHRTVVIGSLAAGIFFILGFLVSHELPKLRSFMLVKIEEASRDHLPVRVLPGKIDIGFFPLGATLTKVRILAKPEVADVFEQAAIERVTVTLSPWLLLSGRVRLSDVEIAGAVIDIIIPPAKKKSGAPLDGFFNLLNQVPLNKIDLSDVALNARIVDSRAIANLANLNLVAEKRRGGGLRIALNSVSGQVTDLETKTAIRVDAEAHVALSRDEVKIDDLQVRRGETVVNLEGSIQGDVEKLKFDTMDLEAKSEIQLESTRNWAVKRFRSLAKLPVLRGRANLQASVIKKKNESIGANFDLKTSGFGLMKMNFDKIEAKGTLQEHEVSIPEFRIENAAGTIAVNNLKLNTEAPYPIAGDLDAKKISIHELLKVLGVGDIPVWFQASGTIPCSGNGEPFLIECRGELAAEDILVRDSVKSKGTIIAIRKLQANGTVAIDASKVKYAADLAAPLSRGKSDGVIGYDDGFKINYETESLDFKDVANLADLKVEGSARIKGSTEGDSDSASLSMELDGRDVWFEDFWLGQARTLATYKSKLLTFANLAGHYTVSRYSGDVSLDFGTKTITVDGRIPFFDARDLLKVFSRQVTLPFPVTGTGQASIRATGPLAINRLSYTLKSSLFKGSVSGETFDQAHFDVKSVGGEVKTERVDLLKGTSQISLTGTGHPDGTIRTKAQGREIKLEDSSIINTLGLALSGRVDFDMRMDGPVLSPETDMQGKITQTAVGDQGLPDSEFKMRFRSNSIEGSGTLGANTEVTKDSASATSKTDIVKTSFTIPFDSQSPFRLKLATNDWNYAPVFAALAGTNSRKDYEGHLTTAIDLSSTTGGFWNSSGSIGVDKFSLKRGNLVLATTEPLRMKMSAGQLHVEKFDLSGENIYLRVNDSPNPVSKIDLQVQGKIDLTLAAILTPFLEDLRGLLSFTFNLRSGPTTTELLGSAYIDKAFLKLFGFPHPLENIQADILFNQRKLLFNTIKAELGGGRVNGTGGMELKGYKNYPVNLAGTFDKVTFNLPEKVRTTGSGTLSFTGNWFPFVLKADYDIKEGLATKDFGGSADQNDGIRRDFFLPATLLAETFTPVVLDLNVNFNRGIAVKNELVEGRIVGALTVTGKPSKPAIAGSITTDRETYIIVKDTRFEITSSNIQFNNPAEINPKLYIAARARKNEYDISLLVQGTASAPVLAFSSVPPLSEKDIISILAIGATEPRTNAIALKTNEQSSNTELAAGGGVIKKNPVTSLIKDSIGFDVQFSPGFDETGSSAVQKIIVSRQFNQRFDVTASRSVGGRQQETQARARYRLNDRVSLIGSWLGRDYTETQTTTTTTTTTQQSFIQNPNAFGLDLEYKFEFK